MSPHPPSRSPARLPFVRSAGLPHAPSRLTTNIGAPAHPPGRAKARPSERARLAWRHAPSPPPSRSPARLQVCRSGVEPIAEAQIAVVSEFSASCGESRSASPLLLRRRHGIVAVAPRARGTFTFTHVHLRSRSPSRSLIASAAHAHTLMRAAFGRRGIILCGVAWHDTMARGLWSA